MYIFNGSTEKAQVNQSEHAHIIFASITVKNIRGHCLVEDIEYIGNWVVAIMNISDYLKSKLKLTSQPAYNNPNSVLLVLKALLSQDPGKYRIALSI